MVRKNQNRSENKIFPHIRNRKLREDDILRKKVWGPLDAKKQERALDGLGNYDDKNFKKAVIDANQTKGLKLQAELSKKSVIGLFIIAFLLIFCGYETSLPEICAALLYDLHTCMAYTITIFDI